MKTKILRKGRKKYSYYFNAQGEIVLINHLANSADVIDTAFLANYYKTSEKEVLEVPCGYDEFKWRTLKSIMFSKYGWSIKNIHYKKVCKRLSKLESIGIKKRK